MPSAFKIEHPALKNLIYKLPLYFCGSLFPPRSRSLSTTLHKRILTSVVDPDSMGPLDPDSDPEGHKRPTK
jgi:hypothetical protein